MKIVLLVAICLFSYSFIAKSQTCDTCDIFVPNTLTPDCGEFGCELLKIQSNCVFQKFECTIFNRWGERIFESNDPNYKFDCSDVSEGIYLWQLNGNFCSEEEFHLNGYLHVLR